MHNIVKNEIIFTSRKFNMIEERNVRLLGVHFDDRLKQTTIQRIRTLLGVLVYKCLKIS